MPSTVCSFACSTVPSFSFSFSRKRTPTRTPVHPTSPRPVRRCLRLSRGIYIRGDEASATRWQQAPTTGYRATSHLPIQLSRRPTNQPDQRHRSASLRETEARSRSASDSASATTSVAIPLTGQRLPPNKSPTSFADPSSLFYPSLPLTISPEILHHPSVLRSFPFPSLPFLFPSRSCLLPCPLRRFSTRPYQVTTATIR